MDKCSLCEKDLPNERIHLGYTECLDCSEVDKYSSHTRTHIRLVVIFSLCPLNNLII